MKNEQDVNAKLVECYSKEQMIDYGIKNWDNGFNDITDEVPIPSPMAYLPVAYKTSKLTFIKGKPEYKDLKHCLIVSRWKTDHINDYEYAIYEIKEIWEGEEYYWGICDMDGDELGDYNTDFTPTETAIIEL